MKKTNVNGINDFFLKGRLLSFFGIFLMLSITINGCRKATSGVGTGNQDASAEAVHHILAEDEKLAAIRNHACEDTTLSYTINQYVAGIGTLDFSACPEDFTLAFQKHREAWTASVVFFRQFDDLRGEMHDLFAFIEQKDESGYQAALQPIGDTWTKVEEAARRHGAMPEAPYAHIEDAAARALLEKAITRAGGLDTWKNLRELRFQKYFVLYDADGNTESEVVQDHVYTFRPEENFRISWTADSVTHQMIYQNGEAVKTVAGQVDTTADPQSLLNSVLSSTFVISIPFKLLDEGVTLSYVGLDTLEDNQVVEVLQATYHPDRYDSHSTPDTWWHYYAADDYRLVAYLVQHADHFSYVRNLSYMTVEGLLFPRERDSYRVDSLRNLLFLRAAYEYTDYEAAF